MVVLWETNTKDCLVFTQITNTRESCYFITCEVLPVCFLSPEIFIPERPHTWYSLPECHLHMALHFGDRLIELAPHISLASRLLKHGSIGNCYHWKIDALFSQWGRQFAWCSCSLGIFRFCLQYVHLLWIKMAMLAHHSCANFCY